AGLTVLLKKVVGEADTADFPSVAWAGQTLIKLASDEDSGGVEPKPVVKELYGQAGTLFEKLLKRSQSAKKDTSEAKSLNAVRVNLAKSYRRLGKFQQAIDILDSVLDEAPNNLDAQIAAAQVYQDWAAATNDAKYYNYAVLGGPDVKLAVGIQKSPILGWSRLATKLGDSTKGRDKLFEVRYNLAYSMASGALLSTKKAEQTSGLSSAEAQILGTYRVDKEMGGPALKAKYAQLLQIIQGKLGKPTTGLPSDAPAPAATN
ncbi:MAG TPA: tetratricopeptide repeat protein, partial [Pirellulales bacterium]